MSDSSKSGKTKRRVVMVSSPGDDEALMKSSPDTRKVEDGQLVLSVDPSETLTSDEHSDAAIEAESESLDIKPPQTHVHVASRKEKHKKRKKDLKRREKGRVVHKERDESKRERYVKEVSAEVESRHHREQREWVTKSKSDYRQVVNKGKTDLRDKLRGLKEKGDGKAEKSDGKVKHDDKEEIKDVKEKSDDAEAREKRIHEKKAKLKVALEEFEKNAAKEAEEKDAKERAEMMEKEREERERIAAETAKREKVEREKAEQELIERELREKEAKEREEMLRERQAAKENKRRDLMERDLLRRDDEMKGSKKRQRETTGDSSDERHREEGRLGEKSKHGDKIKKDEKSTNRDSDERMGYEGEKRKRDVREKPGRLDREEPYGNERSNNGERYIRGGYEYRPREHSPSPHRERKKREESLKERERLERLERERQRERRVREERERIEREHRNRQQQEERKIARERERRDAERDRSSHRGQRNGQHDGHQRRDKASKHTPPSPDDADDEVSEDEDVPERAKDKRKGSVEEEEVSEVSEEEGEKSESVSADSHSDSASESAEAASEESADESEHEKDVREVTEKVDKVEASYEGHPPTDEVVEKSKFEEGDDHPAGIVDVTVTRPSEDDDANCIDSTPPVSPLELQPDLPIYYPAIQGCRSVEEFRCLNRIEEGTYGVVYRACDRKTNEIVALKRLKMEKEKEGFPITSLREINTLLKAQHSNIVTVREIVVGSNMDKIYIVMDYVEHDLKALMESMKQPFLIGEVKTLLIQLLRAVAHLHDNWILHRDLKTSNLLLSHKGILKVGDFGLAREYGSPLKVYTPIVVTLWYRAPELLLGVKQYSTAIDMWSVGCIFAEFLTMKALWPGKSEIDELNRIFKDLGTPNEKIWPGVSELPGMKKCTFAEYPYNTLRQKFGSQLSDLGFDLLNKFLRYNPPKRISAEEAINNQYFEEAPLPIDPGMFPTWPAKSEMQRKQGGHSPKAPSGGKAFAKLMDDDDEKDLISASGFHMETATKGAAAGGLGFNLRF